MSPAPITDQPGLLGAGLLKAVAQLPGGLEEYVNSDGVVPNVFIWAAFLVTSPLGAVEETTFHEEHPLQRFFDTCAFDESTKQLEICAAHFDVAPDDLNNSNYYAQYPGNKTLFKVDENSLRNTT
jgi:hypothetical protein